MLQIKYLVPPSMLTGITPSDLLTLEGVFKRFLKQMPERRTTQRDETAIRLWKEDRWPAPKKKPQPRSICGVGGQMRVLSIASGRQHLDAPGKDAHPAEQALSGAFLRHQRHYPGGKGLYLMRWGMFSVLFNAH
jgi:hypothetical protein